MKPEVSCGEVRTRNHLTQKFFYRDADSVAHDLIGCFIFNELADKQVVGGQIVEAEAYSEDDPAAHCFDKKPSPPSAAKKPYESMFLPGGHIYMYWDIGRKDLCYLNLTCDREGFGSAVLIRAIEPCRESVATMLTLRKKYNSTIGPSSLKRNLCSGPMMLCEALGIEGALDGLSLMDTSLRLYPSIESPQVARGPRVRVTQGADLLRRYALHGSDFVSEQKSFPISV